MDPCLNKLHYVPDAGMPGDGLGADCEPSRRYVAPPGELVVQAKTVGLCHVESQNLEVFAPLQLDTS